MARSRRGSAPPGRRLRTRLKTAKGRKPSSARWLQRQLNDPYVAAARTKGYRARAAFKLIELDDRFHLLEPGARVVDLGAAPGSWTQVAVERVKAGRAGGGSVVAVDTAGMAPLAGAAVVELDVRDEGAAERVRALLSGPADVVLSDMAAPATGHAATDHLRVMTLARAAFDLACQVLRPGGTLVAKVFQGGTERELLVDIKRRFRSVRHAKPRASRSQSAETYVVAQGFRGAE